MPEKNGSVGFEFGTQAQYDAMTSKNPNIIYICTDTQRMYIGGTQIGGIAGVEFYVNNEGHLIMRY